MSSIMDELKTLQGNRAPAGQPGPSQGEPCRQPECAGPTRSLAGPRRNSYTAMVLTLSGAIAALVALLVVHASGGPARGAVRPVMVAAAERPEGSAPVVHAEVVATAAAETPAAPARRTGGAWAPLLAGLVERAKVHSDVVADTDPEVGVEPEVHTEGWWAPLLAGLVERAKVHSDVVADTDPEAGVEPEGHTEGWWAPLLAGLIERATMHSDVVADTDPEVGVEPEGHTEGWWAPLLAGLIERATMHSDVVAVHTQLEEPEAESVAVVGSESLEIASAEPVEAPLPKPPVRILTLEEDEANKAAIRELKVFGVLADEQGVGVYTSEGELRAGGQFRAMQVTEVTLRSVLFECGNKRYRWLLPH
jgi:hypothetical protein